MARLMVIVRVFKYLWVLPATMLGVLFIPIVLLQGGSVRVVRGVIEIHGGVVTWLLQHGLPWVGAGAAMTVGHTILGCDSLCLDKCREHEHAHIRQYERWGPLLIPVYLAASLVAWLQGGHPYLDNRFERQAREQAAVAASAASGTYRR